MALMQNKIERFKSIVLLYSQQITLG